MKSCNKCSSEFEPTKPTSRICAACLKKQRAEYQVKYRRKHGSKSNGDTVACADCGEGFTFVSGPQVRCANCQKAKTYKSLQEWQRNNPDKLKANSKKARDNMRFDGMRYRAIERDNFACQHCDTNNDLHVHHIDETGQSDTPNNSLDNLITLCRGCHRRVHIKATQLENLKQA